MERYKEVMVALSENVILSVPYMWFLSLLNDLTNKDVMVALSENVILSVYVISFIT